MHSHQVQIILLILTFILSLFLFIASAKYAEWARVMVSGQPSGSWLGLVFYTGSVPLLSLISTALHLLALHFEALPSRPPPSTTSNPEPLHAYTASPSTYLLILINSAIFKIAWLGQSSLCTACELAPILANTQGIVPAWCPQSKFRDSGRADLPKMLASLALVKDVTSWAMVPLSAALVECARRQWQRARIASEHAANWEPGLREYDWKNGITVAGVPKEQTMPGDVIELEPVPNSGMGRRKELPNKYPAETNAVEIGMPPSRKGTFGLTRMQGMPVRQNTLRNNTGYDVGMSYESRI